MDCLPRDDTLRYTGLGKDVNLTVGLMEGMAGKLWALSVILAKAMCWSLRPNYINKLLLTIIRS